MPHTKAGKAFTALVLEVFRLNGQLLAAGDRLTEPVNLSSARWQVLGAIEQDALPVAQIARNMGLARQSVQRLADELEADGLIEYLPNVNHKRAKLVSLTRRGRDAMKILEQHQIRWANDVSAGIRAEEIDNALDVIRRLRHRLESAG
jgi:DNA-binding MarR family transcriptional regulator